MYYPFYGRKRVYLKDHAQVKQEALQRALIKFELNKKYNFQF